MNTGRTLTPADSAALEAIIDRTSLAAVVEAIAAICYGKQEHVLTNWQDRGLAQAWYRAAVRVEATAASNAVRVLP